MRWDNLLQEQTDTDEQRAKLPMFREEAVVRRFKTPEFRGMTFYEVRARSIINHVKGERFGFSWTINPYRGCSHACTFCFARPTHTYLDFDAGKDFETQIVVKTNAPELLHKELRRKSWGGELIAMGTNTDPYQRAEGHYKLMRGIIKELNEAGNPYSILTKGTLIKRDIDLLKEGAAVTDVNTCFSVGTVDEKVWKETEPGTPHPMKRLEVLRILNEAGVPCGVLMAPVLPGISDSPEQLQETVKAIVDAGATFLSPLVLHLRPGVKEEFMPWLEDTYPELVARYESTYKGRSYYAPKDIQEPVTKSVVNLKAKFGFKEVDRDRYRRGEQRPAEVKEESETQMTLDLDAPESRRVPSWVYRSS